MLEGRTADCLAIANTAILMRLVERRHHKARCHDGAEGCWGQPAKLSERRSQQFRGCRGHHSQGIDAETCLIATGWLSGRSG
jgi:hypothetical protein